MRAARILDSKIRTRLTEYEMTGHRSAARDIQRGNVNKNIFYIIGVIVVIVVVLKVLGLF